MVIRRREFLRRVTGGLVLAAAGCESQAPELVSPATGGYPLDELRSLYGADLFDDSSPSSTTLGFGIPDLPYLSADTCREQALR